MNTANNDDIMKLSLTELLTRQYTSTVTFLFENESPPSNAVQTNETKDKEIERVSNDIKSLNCTKLSLLIVKALLSSTTTTNGTTDNTIEGSNEHANQQLSTSDFLVKIKLDGNNLILLDAGYYPEIQQQEQQQQSIGQLLHAIFTSSSSSAANKQTQIIQQKSSMVSEESSDVYGGDTEQIVDGEKSRGGKDLRIAKVRRRSQANSLFSTLGKLSSIEFVLGLCYDVHNSFSNSHPFPNSLSLPY